MFYLKTYTAVYVCISVLNIQTLTVVSSPDDNFAGKYIQCEDSDRDKLSCWQSDHTDKTMSKYTLYYFPIRGRAQAIRYIFIENGLEFDEINIVDGWETKWKPQMPFGQVPMVKDGDLDVAQSSSILRYLGRKHGMYPEDILEVLKADMVTDHVEDIRGPYATMIYENYENGKETFIKTLPTKLGYLENLFKKWGTDYISSKISFADYNLFTLLDDLLILSPPCLDEFPTLKAYFDRMASRPALQKYRDSDSFKNLPVNFNGKQ